MPSDHFYFPPFHPNCRCTVEAVKDISAFAETGELENYRYDPLMSGNFQSFDDIIFQNAAELAAYLESQEKMKLVSNLVQTKLPQLATLDLGETDLEFSMEIQKTLAQSVDSIEKITSGIVDNWLGDLSSITLEKGSKENGTTNALAWAATDGTSITFNSKYFKTIDTLTKHVEKNVKNGNFITPGDDHPLLYVISHEMAHILYEKLPKSVKDAINVFIKANSSPYFPIKHTYSKVAAQNTSEFFAELLAKAVVTDNLPYMYSNSAADEIKSIFESAKK